MADVAAAITYEARGRRRRFCGSDRVVCGGGGLPPRRGGDGRGVAVVDDSVGVAVSRASRGRARRALFVSLLWWAILLVDVVPRRSGAEVATAAGGGASLNNVSVGSDVTDNVTVVQEASPVASPGNELPIVGPPLVTSSSSGSCQIYQGVTCGQYLGNRSVFVRPPPATLAAMEEKLAAAFTVIATSQDVSATCHKYAIPSLCFFVFPPCEPAPGAPPDRPPEPRSVCRDECELLEQSLCRMEYSIAKRHPLIGQQNILPVCEDLPPIGSPEAQSCLRLGVPHRETDDVNKEEGCYVHGGEDYRGVVAETVSGLPCQPWTHQILFSRIAEYPEIVGGHNYCRNPGGMESQPWCFTSGAVVKKEICNIPKCVDYLWLYILLPSMATLALIGLLLGIACFRRRAKPSPPPSAKNFAGKAALRGPAQQNLELGRLLPRPTRQAT
ncbi:hypothetical protein HPB50_011542 [Hyalomma asiaticum]|uniref:Uncharacterized protein n=1 Tax=Hyalomma asiaticum TaxID=266040 RepID=A0ACB7T1I8_HYAAI|nr:hypothetical protein HPB50_011542 [Hyalomma asiaticum]